MGALLAITAAGEPGPPNTLPRLLHLLHIEAQSAHQQQSVLRHWLDYHDPSPPLRVSMRANGFGLLLNELDAARRATSS
ncbi:hypothetical protein [Mycolicibacterium mengxianglii]|uniref:hypothetical protein n=1 Tax=Mycolicibacterium mengxianglii TaxID=2736649 RepID=UPI0018D0B5D6|nr:hypothetical protein [Mycolicibacterium mengxianglii]